MQPPGTFSSAWGGAGQMPPAGVREDELVDVSSDSGSDDEGSEDEAPGASPNAAQAEPPAAPAPRVAPRGLAGIFDDYTPDAVLDVGSLPHNAVLLNVYDVSDNELIQRINAVTTANNNVLVGGVFHAGVEVYRREWGFGATEEARTGISAVWPRVHPQHTYRATVHMGNTALSQTQVHAVLVRMAPQWLGNSYSLIHRNCLSFCNAFLQELGLRRIPGWVDRAARAASQVDRAVQLARTLNAEEVQSQATNAMQLLRRESSTVLEVARTESAKLVEQTQSEVRREAAEVQAKAAEIGEKAQESIQALGATLWKWGQDLGAVEVGAQRLSLDPSAIVDTAGIGEKVLDITGKAQEHVEALGTSLWQLGQNLHNDASVALNGLPGATPHKPRRKKGGREKKGKRSHRGHSRADLDGEGADGEGAAAQMAEHRAVGLIRAREERLMSTGLLAESDEEDDGSSLPVARLPPTHPTKRSPGSGQGPLPVVEAPIEWLSQKPVSPSTTLVAPTSDNHPAENLLDDPYNLMAFTEPQACSSPWPARAEAPAQGTSVDMLDLFAGDQPATHSPPSAAGAGDAAQEAPAAMPQATGVLASTAASPAAPQAPVQHAAIDLLA